MMFDLTLLFEILHHYIQSFARAGNMQYVQRPIHPKGDLASLVQPKRNNMRVNH